MGRLTSVLSTITRRLRALPTGAKVVLGVAVVAGLAVGSVFMYRTYDYVQHDNQFCMECHLMQDPFERFSRSAHRGLGCKACHRPNMIERSTMGLAQIIENPDSIRVHAHVPNEICAECHIEGDPEEWLRVANTAGHRIHLESDDPALEGLNCVECHSSGVHQFTPTDQTCGQGGCHESVEVKLGEMADLTIHCAACHDFATPIAPSAPTDTAFAAIRPEANECLACHQMRSMMADLPPDEPHGAACGACHNPHQQTTPAQAVESCATGGCHAQPDTLTPYHRGLDTGVLENCTACHVAHEFRIHEAGDCLSCHGDIYQDAPARGVAARTTPGIRLASAAPSPGGRDRLAALALAAHARDFDAAPLPQDTAGFWHSQHRGVECSACHTMEGSHGRVTVTSIRDCRSCHHTAPVADECATCHTRAEVRQVQRQVTRTMDMRIGSLDRPRRSLPFAHAVHEDLACAECHTEGLTLSAAAVSCSGCHGEHHEPDMECRACHATPADNAHDAQVHLGCAGSGCHGDPPVRGVPRTRDFCLVCHQDLVDHRPGRNCEDCHALPQPTAGGGAAGQNNTERMP